MCCLCGGGTHVNCPEPDPCADTANGATDEDGDGCENYDEYPSDCGYYDDMDFSSNVMCCACGGGTTGEDGAA